MLRAAGHGDCMTITTLALVNALLVLATVVALGTVVSVGLRIGRATNAESVVPAEPVELARAA
jgi:hypothetical protein